MTDGSFVDYYELLGVSTNASAEQIRQAFVALAKQHHPDVGGSTEQMQQFSKAYGTLMSASQRKAYDLLHDFNVGGVKTQYRDYGKAEGSSIDDLSDDEIDSFLDAVYQEYRTEQAVKQAQKVSWKQRIQQLFSS